MMPLTLHQIGKQIANCEAKSAYPSEDRAMAFANLHGLRQHPYRCPVCDQWHLTSQGEQFDATKSS
jgi:hypothetical protein